jgi:hypothetical protein
MNRLSRLWAFLTNSDNRAALAWISGTVIAVVSGLWTVYVYFTPPPPPPPAPKIGVTAPVDPAALETLRKSQEGALKAEACAMDNVTRQISGLPPIPCPAPGTPR